MDVADALRNPSVVIAGGGLAGLTAVLASQIVTWETDPWAQGGYAVFKPSYDPELREWLGRPHGRVFFAGEHTSWRWQGYMNGAVESGLRVAQEVMLARTSDVRRTPAP